MGFQTWIANQLRSFGLVVEEDPGWTTRGSSTFTPKGVILHWTAGPCNATGRPSLSVVKKGRHGLPGPLANLYLDRAGIWVVVAAGRANHAGEGGYKGLSGNSSVFGIECECCNVEDWTQAQLDVIPIGMAALLSGIAKNETWGFRHCDWAPKRKIDTKDLSLGWIQAGIKETLLNGGKEDFLAALTDDEQQELLYKVRQIIKTSVSTGKTPVVSYQDKSHAFYVKRDGTLMHYWYSDKWNEDSPSGEFDPDEPISVVPDAGGLLQVFGTHVLSGKIITTQWNPFAGRWETGILG